MTTGALMDVGPGNVKVSVREEVAPRFTDPKFTLLDVKWAGGIARRLVGTRQKSRRARKEHNLRIISGTPDSRHSYVFFPIAMVKRGVQR
jgi:hypothetical protein